jgi:hypothetical protein
LSMSRRLRSWRAKSRLSCIVASLVVLLGAPCSRCDQASLAKLAQMSRRHPLSLFRAGLPHSQDVCWGGLDRRLVTRVGRKAVQRSRPLVSFATR